MHVPDGLLDPITCISTGLISSAAVAYSLSRVQTDLPSRTIPLMGVTAACIFAAQMINFPIPGGTSGHLLGGLLAAVLLGPWAGLIVMATVLFVQCVLFQDGGITTLGANIVNLGIASSIFGYALYVLIRRRVHGQRGILAGAVIASWFSVQIGAVLCSVELSAGSHFGLAPTLGIMLLFHSLIGIGEALVTGLALCWIVKVRPDLIYGNSRAPQLSERTAEVLAVGMGIAIVLAAVLSPFASLLPDGLEATITRLGFDRSRLVSRIPAPLADYQVPGLEVFGIAGSVAGIIGAFAAMLLAISLTWNWPRSNPATHE